VLLTKTNKIYVYKLTNGKKTQNGDQSSNNLVLLKELNIPRSIKLEAEPKFIKMTYPVQDLGGTNYQSDTGKTALALKVKIQKIIKNDKGKPTHSYSWNILVVRPEKAAAEAFQTTLFEPDQHSGEFWVGQGIKFENNI
jgi:hypothetical protein